MKVQEALGNLTMSEINSLKSFKVFPPALVPVLKAVAVLLEFKNLDTNGIKSMVKNTDFLNRLLNFDKDNIKPDSINKIQEFLAEDCFTPEN